VNSATENIGARRLATILETVLEDISFEAGEGGPRAIRIDAEEVRKRVGSVAADQDLSRYIL
jgi:ATP-dependent HslUV protease ATP-binding subunit HslU